MEMCFVAPKYDHRYIMIIDGLLLCIYIFRHVMLSLTWIFQCKQCLLHAQFAYTE